jgi:hypothetical protein
MNIYGVVYSVIPSGSLAADEVSTPTWAQPTVWWGVEIGGLARVLPLGGPEWVDELVVILREESRNAKELGPRYVVAGRKGVTILPYYALSVERYTKNGV